MKFSAHERRVGVRLRPRTGLDEQHRRPPLRQVVAERAHLEAVVVSADAARANGSSASRTTAAEPLREQPALVHGPRLVVRHGQERDRRRPRWPAGRRVPALIVQVEPDARVQLVAEGLEQLAFRRLQQQRVAIDVEALRVPALPPLGAVRVEHRHACGPSSALSSCCTRGSSRWRCRYSYRSNSADVARRFVAVHLRPHQHDERAGPERHDPRSPALRATARSPERESAARQRNRSSCCFSASSVSSLPRDRRAARTATTRARRPRSGPAPLATALFCAAT